jgi:predicted Zn-dependent protease
VRQLQRVIADVNRGARRAEAPPDAAELAGSLRQLGYLSGSSGRAGSIDPKDGIKLLDEFEKAKDLTRSGRATEAIAALTVLVKASPGNVPFLVRLAEAQAAAGEVGDAIETVGDALALNPGLDFLHLQLARLLTRAGRIEEGRASYRAALALNPRLAPAWLGLAELAAKSGGTSEELRLLREAEAEKLHSGALYARLAQVELAAGDTPAAATHALEAMRLLPDFAAAWWVAGEVAEKQDRPALALERFEKALALGLEDPRALVKVGRLLMTAGRASDAEIYLRRAIVVGAGTASAEDARRLLSRGN